jgi:hypothetical protein
VLLSSSQAATDEKSSTQTLLDFDFQEVRDKPPFGVYQGIRILVIAPWHVDFTSSLNRSGLSSGSPTPDDHRSLRSGKTVYALLLERTRQECIHRRIGVAEIPEEKFKSECWKLKPVTIV